MSASTLTFAAYTAYLGILNATLTPLGVVVFDGPPITPQPEQSYLILGADDLATIETSGAGFAIDQGLQDWESLGAMRRTETFEIPSVLAVWDGDGGTIATCRETARTYIEAISAALRPPPFGTGDAMLGGSLNQGGAGTGWCGLYIAQVLQQQGTKGCRVSVKTVLQCTALV